jgi:putative DNA primase/helicase
MGLYPNSAVDYTVGPIPENIPREFKDFDHWVVWRLEERDGEPTKVPYSARTGKRASSTDSRTWATFFEALEALEDGRWSGLGFVFSSGDPFVGIDFDKCRDPETGEVAAKVLEYIGKFEDAYVEISTSGKGIHLITQGKLREGKRRGKVEMYGQGRFFALTGVLLDA